MKNAEEILDDEANFQDSRAEKGIRSDLDVLYEGNNEVLLYIEDFLNNLSGRILILGCGDVDISMFLQYGFDEVVGVDISPKSIEKISKVIQKKRLGKKVKVFVMDAHHLKFNNNYFDCVYGMGVLHHLDIEKAIKEVKRVLKQNNTMLFMEPLGLNPITNYYRKITPNLRTKYEHPLKIKDFKLIRKYFDVELKGFYLFTILCLGFKIFIKSNTLYKVSRRVFMKIDSFLLSTFPFLKYLCWIIVIKGTKYDGKK